MTVEAPASEASSPRPTPALGAFGRALRRYAIFIILAALIVFFDFAEPAFLRVNNLFSVLQSVAVVALLGIGVTVTLAVDGFDLSVGSIAAFTLMMASYAMVVLQFGAAATVALRACDRRRDRARQWPAHRRPSNPRSPGDARHDVPARRAAAHPERRTLDHYRAHSFRRLGRSGRLRSGVSGDWPLSIVGRRAAAGCDRRDHRGRRLVLHGAHPLGPRLLCGRRQRDGCLSRRRASSRATASLLT